ncbi:MAG: hypothetical protein ABI743_08775, partial [bacterium]
YYIAHALAPADVYSVEIFEETLSAEVVVPDDQVSLAIGRGGQNVRLAAKLTGWHIDIKKQSDKLAAEALAVNLEAEEAIATFLAQPISELPLRKPALDALTEAGLTTLALVAEQTAEALLALSGFGEAALDELKLFLARNGVSLVEAIAESGEATGPIDVDAVLALKVSDLPLSSGAKNGLLDAGFTSVADMVGVPTTTLFEITGFTAADLEAFKQYLLSLGVLYDTGEESATETTETAETAVEEAVAEVPEAAAVPVEEG